LCVETTLGKQLVSPNSFGPLTSFQRNIMKKAVALSILLFVSATASAETNQFSAGWIFWSLGVQVSSQQTYASNFSGAYSQTATPYYASRGGGLQGKTNGPVRTWAFNLPSYSTFADAIASDAYIEMNVGPKTSGYLTQLSEISLLTSVGGGSISVGLFSSQLGFTPAQQIGTSLIMSSTNSASPESLLFSGISDTFSSSLVSYRLYFTSSQTNWFALGGNVGFTTNNSGLVLRGNSAVVPEPNMFYYLYAVFGIWILAVILSVLKKNKATGPTRFLT